MSISKAILFWSKKEGKSVRMKKIIDTLHADIETISVDSSQVRQLLLDDDRYSIEQIPSVLLLFTNGSHKVLEHSSLDQWFAELIENIKRYHQQQQQQLQMAEQIRQQAQPSPPELVLQDQETPIDMIMPQNVPKALRRTPVSEDNMPNRPMPSPGKALIIDEEIYEPEPSDSPMQQALAREHIRTPETKQVTKNIKTDAVSPSELAKQMADQRKQMEENEEQQRPFI